MDGNVGKSVKTHRFNGRQYTVLVGEFDGFSDKYTRKSYSLIVNCDTNTRKGLITLVHEAMHCGNWDKHEKTIDRTSKEIGGLLWRLGYRRKT